MSEVQSWLMDENKSPIQKDEDKTARVLISTLYEIYTTNKMMSKTQFGKDINKIDNTFLTVLNSFNTHQDTPQTIYAMECIIHSRICE